MPSLQGSHWVRVAPFWLAFCLILVQVPLSGQSTNSGPLQNESRQSAVSSLSSLSDELVLRLKLRAEQSTASEVNFKRLVEDLNEFEGKFLASEMTLAGLQTEHAATLNSLSDLQTAYEDSKKATADRQMLDAKALEMARANGWMIGLGGVAVGALALELLHLLGVLK